MGRHWGSLEMRKEKKKPKDNDVCSKTATKKPREEFTEEVAEEEVEEFFAILRRIQVAVKYFNKVDGASGSGLKHLRISTGNAFDEIVGDNIEMKEKGERE
ncbi:hypothetical protein HAX54_030927 [Datura stramonium]|uniref:Uncharacterized protein n=1 Tax=Datura stramonium TaxID=4076 RepID=A0ABS8SBR7_DATST|nr:hypothetical protein [Datura stramonium]